MLTIYLKSGVAVDVNDFEKVSYYLTGTLKEKTKEQFSQMSIHDALTYNFSGSTKVSINGSEIQYLVLS